MGYRVYLAVIGNGEAQKLRTSSLDYYQKIADDWGAVQKILCEECEKDLKASNLSVETVVKTIKLAQNNGLYYDTRILTKHFWSMFDGPFEMVKYDKDMMLNTLLRFDDIANNAGLKECYCIGDAGLPNDVGNPFFLDKALQEKVSYYNPRVIRKDELENLIESWRKLVANHYKEVLLDPRKEERWRGFLEAKLDCWEFPNSEPYDMSEENSNIVKAFNLEYKIFDLVRLYKSIDWMRSTVVLYGC